MSSKRKSILVTGVAGFLGSHLAEKLVDLGHNVIGLIIFLEDTRTMFLKN